jgi:ABC-type Mn2+/Zn2+ transport system permease subunit
MGSLIIPAATAMRLGKDLRSMQTMAVEMAMLATLSGTLLAPALGLAPVPLTIVIAAAIFFVSLALHDE